MNAVLILLFGSLHVTDGALTYLGLSLYGLVEVNPMLLGVANQVGLEGAIIGGKTLELAFARHLYRKRGTIFPQHPSLTATMVLAVLFYMGVVANNAMLLFGASHVKTMSLN